MVINMYAVCSELHDSPRLKKLLAVEACFLRLYKDTGNVDEYYKAEAVKIRAEIELMPWYSEGEAKRS